MSALSKVEMSVSAPFWEFGGCHFDGRGCDEQMRADPKGTSRRLLLRAVFRRKPTGRSRMHTLDARGGVSGFGPRPAFEPLDNRARLLWEAAGQEAAN
jgi:hypothetical protein